MMDGEFFCPVCREGLVLELYEHVDPIDACEPAPHDFDSAASFTGEEYVEFEVQVMKPESHPLEVRWWVLPEAEAPASPAEPRPDRKGRKNRRKRGALPEITAKPEAVSKHNRKGEHSFTFKPKDYDPGRYRVVCRALDTTELRGERFPWVLKDEQGLLESERAWWVEVPPRD